MGRLIVTARKERGMTQTDLAKLLGVSQPALVKWEKGYSHIPDRRKKQFVKILGLEYKDFFEGD